MRFRKKHQMTDRFGSGYRYSWSVECAHGAIEFWYSEFKALNKEIQKSGGIEVHYRQPPDYMKDDCPSHHDCPLIGDCCWHDGSSLQADDWYDMAGDHEAIFARLEQRAKEVFLDAV